MKVLNLKTPIVNFNGVQIIDSMQEKLVIGKCLANLVLQNGKDSLRSYSLAEQLYKLPKIELNASDFELVRLSCEANGIAVYGNVMISGQILKILSDLKEVEETPKKKK